MRPHNHISLFKHYSTPKWCANNLLGFFIFLNFSLTHYKEPTNNYAHVSSSLPTSDVSSI